MRPEQRWASVDPGSHTGVAFWIGSERRETACWHVGKLPMDVVRGVRPIASTLLMWLGEDGLIVCEDFLLRGRLGSTDREGLSPVQVTFAVLAYLSDWGWTGELGMQLVSEAKTVITDDRLSRYGMYDGNSHIKDATRHGLLWLRKHPVRV